MKIYTRAGDQGKSSLHNGCQLDKSDPVFAVLASVDKVCAMIGFASSLIETRLCLLSGLKLEIKSDFKTIQKKLMATGAEIAKVKLIRDKIEESDIQFLEKQIDNMMNMAGELKNFILPGGTVLASHLHFVRAEIRFLELRLHSLKEKPVNPHIAPFINRLSDYFFAAARYINKMEGGEEVEWK